MVDETVITEPADEPEEDGENEPVLGDETEEGTDEEPDVKTGELPADAI